MNVVILSETALLDVPAKAVIAFLEDMEANYLRWHPDHQFFHWLPDATGQPNARRRFSFRERIARVNLHATMTLERSADGHIAICRPAIAWQRWVLPWMSFEVRPADGGCRYIHQIKIRAGALAPLFNALLLNAVRRHMHEEALNLGRLLVSEARLDGR